MYGSALELDLLSERLVLQASCAFLALMMVIVFMLFDEYWFVFCTARCWVNNGSRLWSLEALSRKRVNQQMAYKGRGGAVVMRCFIEATLEYSWAPGAYVQASARSFSHPTISGEVPGR